MRIRRLELFGFKSFPDRTTFEFGSGISCVVGPNGSGKSNVVDALRWVIGEQSARSLRGKDMADVIFAGSAVRSPVGFAEVVLVLGVDGGEPFPGDLARFEEVELGRRLYRDGTSEYLLNKTKCRRRDIVDLFMDTGVGSNLYSFIAQGQVDRIVSQSALERRSLIDEAAGISRYKVKRHEALQRLTATAGQLDRAADVEEEMSKRLRMLERQVLKAGRFRRCRAKIRQREIALGVVKYAGLSEDRRAIRAQLRESRDKLGVLERSIERVTAEVESREKELASVGEAVTTWRDQIADLEGSRRAAEGARELHKTRYSELSAESDRASKRAMDARVRAVEASKETETISHTLREIEQKLEDSVVASLHEAGQQVSVEVERLQGERARLSEEAARRAAQRQTLESELHRLSLEPVSEEPEGMPDVVGKVESLDELQRMLLENEEAVVLSQAELNRERVVLEQKRAELNRQRQSVQEATRRWERRRSDHERRTKTVHRWADQQSRALAKKRRQEETRWFDQLRSRADRWDRAIATVRKERTAAVQQRFAARARQLEIDTDAAIRRAREQERVEVEDVRAQVNRGGVVSALAAVESGRCALQEAELERHRCSDEVAECSGVLRALRAEWEVLESQRRASVPEEWRKNIAFGDVVEEDSVVRVARPDLVSLPVVTLEQLSIEQGRGVLIVPSKWRMAEDREEAIALLRELGPPVVARDGTLRVDSDGVVDLSQSPTNRWDEVRALIPAAEGAVEAAREALKRAQRDWEACQQRQKAAEAALQQEQAELDRAIEEAIERAHSNALALVEKIRRHHNEALEREKSVRDTALEGIVTTTDTWLRQSQNGRTIALGTPYTAPALPRWIGPACMSALPGTMTPRPSWTPPVLDESRVRALEQGVDEARRQRDQNQRALRALQREIAELERQRSTIQARWEGRRRVLEQAQQRQVEITSLIGAIEEVVGQQALEEELRVRVQERVQLAEQEREARAQISAFRERKAALLARSAGLCSQAEQAEADSKVAMGESEKAKQQADLALQSSEESLALATKLAVERGEVQERLSRDQARFDSLRKNAERVRKQLSESERSQVRLDALSRELEQRVERLQLEIESLRKSLGDRYQVSLPGLLDRLYVRKELVFAPDASVEAPLVVGDKELEAVEKLEVGVSFLDDEDRVVRMVDDVQSLRAELSRLGDVNLAAEEEYRDLAARHADLLTQRRDLEASIQSIRAAIAKMNRTCRERFRDAYDRVNEAFQVCYPELVGGGDARLALTNEEDLLETGVDIFVRPPGKRLQNLTLLSGGEKAMTAIALLLALFRVRPSPFCVLDEVDAPLDEANGARFNDMIRQMSSMSQFIVITHNRKTMECADVLYGVTMANPGVSSLVSVALDV